MEKFMMEIKIKCFSFVRYALEEKELKLELEEGASTQSLEDKIREMAKGKLDGIVLRTAVNQSYITKSIELHDGDEVVFIPPVQGG